MCLMCFVFNFFFSPCQIILETLKTFFFKQKLFFFYSKISKKCDNKQREKLERVMLLLLLIIIIKLISYTNSFAVVTMNKMVCHG